jgi:hypothetical protein
MNFIPTFTPILKRKLVTAVLITASVAAFATLGDGGKKRSNSVVVYNYSKHFSLRSGFNYKSNKLFDLPEPKNFIMLNTVVTYQKGSATYIIPLRKKVLLDKIRINPTPFKY